jgi:hypothetical protein
MKKIIYAFPVLLCLAAAVGCSDWGEEPALNILELESANVSFDAFGGSGDIVVKSTDNVTASCSEAWCATAVSGNKVTVTVPANGELLGRTTVVTVISGMKKVQVPVTQSGVLIDFDRSPLTLSGEAGDTTMLINAPVPLTVTSSATWLAPSITDAALTLRAEDNPAFTSRSSTLTLTAGSFSVAVEVTQRSRKAWLPFDAYVGTWTFIHTTGTLTTATQYSKQATAVASGDTALHVTLKVGTSGSSTFTFVMTYDPTTGTVNIPVQKLFKTTDNTDVSFFAFNGSTSIRFAGGMIGIPTGGTLAKPVLTFKDSEDSTTYIGLALILEPNSFYMGFGIAASTFRYTNITMKKQ